MNVLNLWALNESRSNAMKLNQTIGSQISLKCAPIYIPEDFETDVQEKPNLFGVHKYFKSMNINRLIVLIPRG